MDMAVHKSRRYVLSLSLDHPGVRPDAVGAIPHQGDPPLGDGHVRVLLNLTGTHIDQPGIPDHRLRRNPSLCRGGQRHSRLPQWRFTEFVNHTFSFLSLNRNNSALKSRRCLPLFCYYQYAILWPAFQYFPAF